MSHSAPENSRVETSQPAWGPLALNLDLPSGKVRLYGLSASQAESMEASFSGFLNHTQALDEETLECRAYRLDVPPQLSVSDLSRDGQYSPQKRRRKGSDGFYLTGMNFVARVEPSPGSTDSSIGTASEEELPHPIVIENFLRVISAHGVLRRGGVMLHSAGLVFDGRAYLFCGRSNAGKTTLTRKAWGCGARVLSDDINLVMPDDRGYRAHAVPFTGEFGRTLDQPGGGESFPVAGLILLEQGNDLYCEEVSRAAAVAAILAGCPFVNDDEQTASSLLDVLLSLVSTLPVVRLVSRKDHSIEAIMNTVKEGFAAFEGDPT